MVEAANRMKGRKEETMGTMEILVAVMVVAGTLLWLVKLEATGMARITAREELPRAALGPSPFSKHEAHSATTFSLRSAL